MKPGRARAVSRAPRSSARGSADSQAGKHKPLAGVGIAIAAGLLQRPGERDDVHAVPGPPWPRRASTTASPCCLSQDNAAVTGAAGLHRGSHWKDEPETQDFPAAESYLSRPCSCGFPTADRAGCGSEAGQGPAERANAAALCRQGHPAGRRPAAAEPGRLRSRRRPQEGQGRQEAVPRAAGPGDPVVGR
jgi:hypothetical protein